MPLQRTETTVVNRAGGGSESFQRWTGIQDSLDIRVRMTDVEDLQIQRVQFWELFLLEEIAEGFDLETAILPS